MYTNKYFFLKIVVNRNKAQNIASMFKIYLLNKLRSICSEYLINQSSSTQYVMHIIIFQYSWKLFIFFSFIYWFFFRLFFKNDLKCIKNTNTNFSTHKCYFLKEKKHLRSTIIAFVSINLRSAELQRHQFIIYLSLWRHYKMQYNAWKN